jgi:hypothetical protein
MKGKAKWLETIPDCDILIEQWDCVRCGRNRHKIYKSEDRAGELLKEFG